MLSPADFIFNDTHDASFLETQHYSLTNSSSYFGTTYCDPVNKLKNSYSGNFVDDFTFSNEQLLELYSSYLQACFPSSDDFNVDSIFFPGIRYLSEGLIVYERPPSYQVIDIDNDYRDAINTETSSSRYYIPIPWQVYVCSYDSSTMRLVSVKMFFSQTSLTSVDQNIYSPPIFNFYSNGNLCRPFFSNMEDIEKYPLTISGIIASAFDWVWNSGFNYDITENISFFCASKKYNQFYPWAKDTVGQSFETLNRTRIHHFSRINSASYFHNFFRCWESVPLDQISSISWCDFTSTDFYHSDWNNFSSDYIHQYISENQIDLDSLEECDDQDCDCSSENYEIERIIESDEYQQSLNYYLTSQKFLQPKTLKQALDSSYDFLCASNLLQKTPTLNTFKKIFFNKF